nr:MAG TPA: hypothetical protein [Caudoviricetes sp.]
MKSKKIGILLRLSDRKYVYKTKFSLILSLFGFKNNCLAFNQYHLNLL